MDITVFPGMTDGSIKAIASKSHAHRLLICAAFADTETFIRCNTVSDDILATAGCIKALGAAVKKGDDGFTVSPAKNVPLTAELMCRESGSTYRFMLPVTCALGVSAAFALEGRLPRRPMTQLFSVLGENGVYIDDAVKEKVKVTGRLAAGDYVIPGNTSSQFITGLLLALPLTEAPGKIIISGGLQSKGYVDITVNAMKTFGVNVEKDGNTMSIAEGSGYISPKEITVEGDWSNAAFMLACAAASGKKITYSGLDIASPQGDKKICGLLEKFGAVIKYGDNSVELSGGKLHGTDIDAGDIPDLVPALAVAAAAAKGKTTIYNASRLRIKESDRLATVSQAMNDIGADISITEDTMTINGTGILKGGETQAFGDHRIAMMAAAAAMICENPVTIRGAEAVAKSYPDFFTDIKCLGIVSKKK